MRRLAYRGGEEPSEADENVESARPLQVALTCRVVDDPDGRWLRECRGHAERDLKQHDNRNLSFRQVKASVLVRVVLLQPRLVRVGMVVGRAVRMRVLVLMLDVGMLVLVVRMRVVGAVGMCMGVRVGVIVRVLGLLRSAQPVKDSHRLSSVAVSPRRRQWEILVRFPRGCHDPGVTRDEPHRHDHRHESPPASALRQSGRRLTRQRSAIWDVLTADPDEHLSAELVADRVRAQIPGVNASTIYRTLDVLVQEGLVRRTDLGGDRAYYEPSHEHLHHHLVCEVCGKVQHVHDEVMGELARRVKASTGYHLSERELTLFGSCPTCARDPK